MQNRVVAIKYDKIVELAKKKNLKIHTLEMRSGLSNGTIKRWRYQNPKLDTLVVVADYLGVAYWNLVERIDK